MLASVSLKNIPAVDMSDAECATVARLAESATSHFGARQASWPDDWPGRRRYTGVIVRNPQEPHRETFKPSPDADEGGLPQPGVFWQVFSGYIRVLEFPRTEKESVYWERSGPRT
jgi:hypothetical protein